MHRGAAEAPFRHRHLLGIEGLSPDDINHVLDLADGYVELNRQVEKKVNTSLPVVPIEPDDRADDPAMPRCRGGEHQKLKKSSLIPGGMVLANAHSDQR
jgi:hypothetical protein